jgi:NAD(P)-dependent dehydrogenase (short-subunit alcohol dehydrogenase family)
MRFKDKVAIVTGAGQGIGEHYAKAIAAEGAAVVVAEINADNAKRVADEIVAAGGKAISLATYRRRSRARPASTPRPRRSAGSISWSTMPRSSRACAANRGCRSTSIIIAASWR